MLYSLFTHFSSYILLSLFYTVSSDLVHPMEDKENIMRSSGPTSCGTKLGDGPEPKAQKGAEETPSWTASPSADPVWVSIHTHTHTHTHSLTYVWKNRPHKTRGWTGAWNDLVPTYFGPSIRLDYVIKYHHLHQTLSLMLKWMRTFLCRFTDWMFCSWDPNFHLAQIQVTRTTDQYNNYLIHFTCYILWSQLKPQEFNLN